MNAQDWMQSSNGLVHREYEGVVLALQYVAAFVELAAIAVMLIGATRFMVGFVRAEMRGGADDRARLINLERIELGRYILAGLELIIVSDIIHTALSLALTDLVFLGLLVLIRSLISYFLDREIDQIKEDPAR